MVNRFFITYISFIQSIFYTKEMNKHKINFLRLNFISNGYLNIIGDLTLIIGLFGLFQRRLTFFLFRFNLVKSLLRRLNDLIIAFLNDAPHYLDIVNSLFRDIPCVSIIHCRGRRSFPFSIRVELKQCIEDGDKF